MIGFPIDPIVQETLNKRKKALKRDKNPYAPNDGKNPRNEIQKYLVRTPYISMFSSPKLLSPTGNTNNQFDKGDIILSNQEYNKGETDTSFSPINYSFDLYSDVTTQGGKYKFKDNPNLQGQFRPQPGVISLTSEYTSTSNVYFNRDVSVTWRCHHIDDLERLSYRFLTLNKLVYVEWGWAYPDEQRTSFITPQNLQKINDPTKLRKEVLTKGKGNFDAVLGFVKNFEWSSTGTGFECKTEIMSQGVDIFNTRINNDTQFVSKGNEIHRPGLDQYAPGVENPEKLISKYSTGVSVNSKEDGGNGQTLPINMDMSVPGVNTNPREVGEFETAVADNTRVDTTEQELEVELEVLTQQEQLFPYTIDNLDIIINEKLNNGVRGQVNILNKTIKRNFDESNAILLEKSKEAQDLYDKIKDEVTEEYDAQDWKNWDKNSLVRDAGGQRIKRRSINIETNRRFQEQNDGKSLQQKKEQIIERYKEFLVERDVKITSNIVYNKNFVQKIDEETLPAYSRTVDVDGADFTFSGKKETKPSEYNSEQTWVRWGWFEDNILNRYFGRITQDGKPIVKIRSVRNEENRPVQEKIVNHKGFLTPDINRFIFPGKFKLGLNSEEEKERRNNRIKAYEDSYNENVELEYAKVFFDSDSKTLQNVRGAVELNPDITLEQLQSIIDTEDKFIPNIEDLKRTSEKLKFLKSLETVMTKDVKTEDELDELQFQTYKRAAEKFSGEELKTFRKSSFESLDKQTIRSFDSKNENEGILRNVFINVNHLQERFKEGTTLGICVNRLLESFNTTTPLFNLIPIVNVKENEGHILFTERRFTENFKPESQLQYEFPIKTTESFIKSTNLQSDITNEGTKILLSQQFANAPDATIDSKTGASISAQIEFDRLKRVGNKYTSFNKEIQNGIEPYLYKDFSTIFSAQEYGQKDGDYTEPLAIGKGDSLSLSSVSDANREKIKLRNEQINSKVNEKSTETSNNVKYAIDFPGNYSENGFLKSRKELQNTENLQGTRFKQAPYDEFGLLFLTNTMSMDGIAGISPGNIYTSNYLPDKFKDNCYFFIQNASQTVDSSTWTTEITGRVLFKYKTTSGIVGADNVLEARKQFEKNNSSRLNDTDNLSDNPELSNLGFRNE